MLAAVSFAAPEVLTTPAPAAAAEQTVFRMNTGGPTSPETAQLH